MGMDQYLLIPFLGGWTSIYQLFWCSPGVQGFDPLPYWIREIAKSSSSGPRHLDSMKYNTMPVPNASPSQEVASPHNGKDFWEKNCSSSEIHGFNQEEWVFFSTQQEILMGKKMGTTWDFSLQSSLWWTFQHLGWCVANGSQRFLHLRLVGDRWFGQGVSRPDSGFVLLVCCGLDGPWTSWIVIPSP